MARRIAELHLGAHEDRRMVADPQRDGRVFAPSPPLLDVLPVMGGGVREVGPLLARLDPDPLDGRVVDERLRVDGRGMGRGEIRAGIAVVLPKRRKDVGRICHDRPVLAGTDALRGYRTRQSGAEGGGGSPLRQAKDAGQQVPSRRHVCEHRHGGDTPIEEDRLFEQQRGPGQILDRVLDRGDLVPHGHRFRDSDDFGRPVDPGSQIPHGQAITMPPETLSVTPVRYRASSEQRNAIALATSSGEPIFPRGMAARSECLTESDNRSSIGVSMGPGATQFARTPSGP